MTIILIKSQSSSLLLMRSRRISTFSNSFRFLLVPSDVVSSKLNMPRNPLPIMAVSVQRTMRSSRSSLTYSETRAYTTRRQTRYSTLREARCSNPSTSFSTLRKTNQLLLWLLLVLLLLPSSSMVPNSLSCDNCIHLMPVTSTSKHLTSFPENFPPLSSKKEMQGIRSKGLD